MIQMTDSKRLLEILAGIPVLEKLEASVCAAVEEMIAVEIGKLRSVFPNEKEFRRAVADFGTHLEKASDPRLVNFIRAAFAKAVH